MVGSDSRKKIVPLVSSVRHLTEASALWLSSSLQQTWTFPALLGRLDRLKLVFSQVRLNILLCPMNNSSCLMFQWCEFTRNPEHHSLKNIKRHSINFMLLSYKYNIMAKTIIYSGSRGLMSLFNTLNCIKTFIIHRRNCYQKPRWCCSVFCILHYFKS